MKIHFNSWVIHGPCPSCNAPDFDGICTFCGWDATV